MRNLNESDRTGFRNAILAIVMIRTMVRSAPNDQSLRVQSQEMEQQAFVIGGVIQAWRAEEGVDTINAIFEDAKKFVDADLPIMVAEELAKLLKQWGST